MSRCRDFGSSGDSQARIFDLLSAMVKLFDTVTLYVFKELILWLKDCDIFSLSQAWTLKIMGDGVSRLPEF